MKSKTILLSILTIFAAGTVRAGSATWSLDPASGDWNTAANWTPATVPNGPSHIATFDLSNTTEVALSVGVEVKGIIFTPSASAFQISTSVNNLNLSGAGLINNSTNSQQFLLPVNSSGAAGTMQFFNSATAGTGTGFTAEGSVIGSFTGAVISFFDSSTADEASFILEGGGTGARTIGGRVVFMGDSTAANATFVCRPGGDTSFGGTLAYVGFYENAGAGRATITAEGATNGNQLGGIALFEGQSKAENATLIAIGSTSFDGGSIFFGETATGDNATVKIYDNGLLQIQATANLGVSIGSLEGNGRVLLGYRRLTVGANGFDTTFAGVMGESGLNGGALTKIGPGTLTLTGLNLYQGGTIVEAGRLLINTRAGSGTGTGTVQVNGGALGGNGIVAGAVTIGNGILAGATLAPGVNGIGLLTIQSGLTFKANSRYAWNLELSTVRADEAIAQSVMIEPGASILMTGRRHAVLPVGTIFTVISNTAATPISGTFANLADGATITIGGNNFQVSYSGGDGNDLTLTVAPSTNR